MSERRVQIYDPDTRQLSTIPARELAAGMVRVTLEGVDEDCWVDPRKLKMSEYRHAPFDDDARALLKEIKDALDDVYPLTLDQWEDGFRRDTNVEREVAIWLHLSRKYAEATSGKSLSQSERADIFKLMLSCANNPRSDALAVSGVTTLSTVESEAVIRLFYGEP